ncbi:hypothetical protein Tcan_09075 [Toxocara canis]|uniref:Uncharacterized protein n=1 Tax=Toxocara canis TaxID=6265 RepID=A0A0B2V4E9_TOXCA|nr:hypothetical protein Tcan_09075 [Toxocara canis]
MDAISHLIALNSSLVRHLPASVFDESEEHRQREYDAEVSPSNHHFQQLHRKASISTTEALTSQLSTQKTFGFEKQNVWSRQIDEKLYEMAYPKGDQTERGGGGIEAGRTMKERAE